MFACPIPIVSGVGHETDFTIADLVADLRAPTPSGAAERVVPDREEWLRAFAAAERRVSQSTRRRLADLGSMLLVREQRLDRAHPGVRLRQHAQRLDELDGRLRRAFRAKLAGERSRFELAMSTLNVVSPLATLERGYAIVADAEGHVLLDPATLAPGDSVDARLARGRFTATVTTIIEAPDGGSGTDR